MTWPDGRRAAVSLTFDDGMESQLEIAVPAMDARVIRATFYVNPAGREDDHGIARTWQNTLARFKPAWESGHEIGNHTVAHPCSLNIDIDREWGRTGADLATWTLERMEADIAEGEARLEACFPGRARSFAYPCYESTLGRGVTRVSYTPLVARRFVAARAGSPERRGDLANDARHADLHHLTAFPMESQPASAMIDIASAAARLGRWAIFVFHGIEEGHLAVAAADFIGLLDHLTGRRELVWVAPVVDVATWLRSRNGGVPDSPLS